MSQSNQIQRFLPPDVGVIPRVTTLVSLPLRRTTEKTIVRWNGPIKITLQALGGAELPYGKMPRMLDAVVATLIMTRDPMWDASTRRLYIGETFYTFAEHKLGITRGGSQYARLRQQLASWIRLAYTIEDYSSDTDDVGGQFVTCDMWHIRWLDEKEWNENPQRGDKCFIQLSEMYIKKIIRENPVPINFEILRKLNAQKSVLAVDIYLWLNRRISYLHHPVLIKWDQLHQQFGGAQAMRRFRQVFKRALTILAGERDANGELAVELDEDGNPQFNEDGTVRFVDTGIWPELRMTVDRRGITIYPTDTHVLTAEQARMAKKQAQWDRQARTEGRWQKWRFYEADAYVTTDLLTRHQDAPANHFEGTVDIDRCPICQFDERNEQFHGYASPERQNARKSRRSHFIGSPDYVPPESVESPAEEAHSDEDDIAEPWTLDTQHKDI